MCEKGSKHTPETRERLVKMLNSYKSTQKYRENSLAAKKARKGKKKKDSGWTPELRARWSKRQRENPWHHTKETRLKIGSFHLKEKNVNWKGGVTPEHEKVRKSIEYYEWRRAVFGRDRFCCRVCFAKGYVNAHHIRPFRDFVELRFDVNNGITVCVDCHKIMHKREHLFISFLQGILENELNSVEVSQEITPSQQERLRKALWACVTVSGE